MREKIYIAGKITGDKNYKEKFAKAVQEIEQSGAIAISPAVLPDGLSTEDYMRICIAMIQSADKVAFLPDWFDSKGANLELHWCAYTCKPYSVYKWLNLD